jgi:stage V sporulation protein AD
LNRMLGKQSMVFQTMPCVTGYGNVVGKKEKEGPLGELFDAAVEEEMAGGDNWEEAESNLQVMAADMAVKRAGIARGDLRYLLAGDLLGQLIATSFGMKEFGVPLFGLYGACSTMGEAASLGAVLVDGGYADRVMALTSSHFASAEKQFRFPLGYGNQRPMSATWTVTGSAALVIEDKKEKAKGDIWIKGITTGKIVDYGIKDSMNMGAAMAPAAADLIENHLKDFGVAPEHYDRIITGDLGYVGKEILLDLLEQKGIDISRCHMDCGIEIFDQKTQDTHAGGSGCACSGVTLTAYVFRKLKAGEWSRVLFVPTGALLSQVSFNEGQSVPGIAHGIIFESK